MEIENKAWNLSSDNCKYIGYRGLRLVVYHNINDLFTWYVETKADDGKRILLHSGQDHGEKHCMRQAVKDADRYLDKDDLTRIF
jgi:hypothetical protein